MAHRDWYEWHAFYGDPDSGLSRRLSWVQDQIRAALNGAPPGPIRAISLCAGQGLDLIGVLAEHPRRADVTARLVELDPRNTEVAARLVAEAGLTQVEIVTGDASLTSQYADLAPANLVLACGLFGNMTDAHVKQMIGYCAQLCAEGGTVIWTRARWEPDLVPGICAWFEQRDFERVSLTSQYAELAPADLVLACGLFGNMTDAHVEATIGYCAQLCAENGTVVWTRARWAPDLVPQICAWFEERGFERAWLSAPNYTQCTGAHRRIAPPVPLDPAAVMFTFTNHNPRTGPSRS